MTLNEQYLHEDEYLMNFSLYFFPTSNSPAIHLLAFWVYRDVGTTMKKIIKTIIFDGHICFNGRLISWKNETQLIIK